MASEVSFSEDSERCVARIQCYSIKSAQSGKVASRTFLTFNTSQTDDENKAYTTDAASSAEYRHVGYNLHTSILHGGDEVEQHLWY